MRELEYPSFASGSVQRVSWGAIFAGVITSLATFFTMTSLGVGIGLLSSPSLSGTGAQIAMKVGSGSGLWMIVSGLVSFYAGGWIAGRLTGIARVSEAVIHGILAWGTATVLAAMLFSAAAAGALGAAASVAGSPNGPRNLRNTTGAAPDAAVDRTDVNDAARAAGAASLLGFVMLAIDAAAACYGAKAGVRLLKPIPAGEHRRERVGV